MSENSNHYKTLVATIVIGLVIVLFSHLNVVELRAEEPRRALVAMEMDITGEYIVPRIHGWNYYNKPPLFNWLLLLFFKIFGSFDTWVVRIPALVAFLLCGLSTFLFARQYVSKETAVLSSLCFLTTGDILFFGTLISGEIDLFFSLVVCLQVMLMYHFFRKQRFLLMFTVSYVLAAMGFLTKGLPAILFQGTTILLVLGYYRKWRLLFSWQHGAGLISFFLLTGTYFYAYAQQTNVLPFLLNLFHEASQKSGLKTSLFKLLTSTLSYPLLFMKWILPWTLLGAYLFSRKTIAAIKSNDFLAFLALFILVNIPVYWITGNPKSRYIYMFVPFLMILLAFAYQERKNDWPKITRTIMLLFNVTMLLFPLALLTIPWLPITNTLPHVLLNATLLFIPSATLAWMFFRCRRYRIYYFMLSLLLVRMSINLFYLPSLRPNTNAIISMEQYQEIQNITKNDSLFLSGEPFCQDNDLDIGLIHLPTQILTAPMISYILPYYYTKSTGRVLLYEESMRPNKWCLIHIDDLDSIPVDTFYSFRDPTTKEDLLLAKVK